MAEADMDVGETLSLLSSPIVEIVVGKPDSSDGLQPRTFFAHKDVLVLNSHFFAKALNKRDLDSESALAGWVEVEPEVVNLPEDKPEVFANYLVLIYHGKTPSFREPDTADLHEYHKEFLARLEKHQGLLCYLYVFAEKAQNVPAKRFLLAAMVDSTKLKNNNGDVYFAGPLEVATIYNGTQKSDPMRKFVTACAVSYGHDGWGKASEFHPEFVDDLVAGIWEHRSVPPEQIRKQTKMASHWLQELSRVQRAEEGELSDPSDIHNV
ncbi:hypothetical protein E8E13_008391 [Curvularia kusanoi]|uniref:BTB domain-containing protein n=1 Tax=Curvularia kusanoi TaxID=90978 RepID=A0A9P4TIQ3_CURKU|nr:hypothetical protein E8E13_008391 [Curvularia kusanoi]